MRAGGLASRSRVPQAGAIALGPLAWRFDAVWIYAGVSGFEYTLRMNILTVNLLFSTLVFWTAARIYVLPKLDTLIRLRQGSGAQAPSAVLLPILLLHGFRHLGLMFLAPGAVYPGLPPEFANPAAYGDLIAAVLALIAIPAVATSAPAAKALVWIFNLEGSLDLILAITLATLYDAAPYMGSAYWIPAFWVPGLLVTHYITFIVLLREWPAR